MLIAMPEGQGTYVFFKVLFQNKVTYGHDDHIGKLTCNILNIVGLTHNVADVK